MSGLGRRPGPSARPHRLAELPLAPDSGTFTAHLPEGAPTGGWRQIDRLVLIVAMAVLLVPATLLAGGIRVEAIENRPLIEMPSLTAGGLLDGSWMAGVDAHLADNMWLRSTAVRLRGEVYFLAGGTGTPQVLRGRDGWLFTRREFDVPCTTSAVEIGAALAKAAEVLEARDATFRFIAVPDKHSIYPERVATNPFPPACTELQRPTLRAELANLRGSAIDGWTVLEAAKAADPTRPLYSKGDTHWTPHGALQVVRALVTSIEPSLWDESAIRSAGQQQVWFDLARQVGIYRLEPRERIDVRPGISPERSDIPVPFDLSNAPTLFRTTVPNDEPSIGGRTLIIYDSYFGTQVRLVSPFFADATWVHAGDMQRNPELATLLGPFDTVIVQRVERFLYTDNLGRMLSDLAP